MRKWVSSFAKKHETMNQSYDITTSEGKSQFIEAYREAVKSKAWTIFVTSRKWSI